MLRSLWTRRGRLPEGWRGIVERSVGHWALLDDDERGRLAELMDELLRRTRWEAARGLELTDEMRVVIAAEAGLLVLGLPPGIDCYRDVTSIIVHPTTVTVRGERPGPASGVVTDAPMSIIGQANDRRGPVLIAWDAARAHARRPEAGHNVVLHEFAHKLDMLDGLVDGTPPLHDPVLRRRWAKVLTAAFQSLRAGHPTPLSAYGAVNPGEFFAVATEAFFGRPTALRDHEPALYAVLTDFYHQDPATRVARVPPRRPGAATDTPKSRS